MKGWPVVLTLGALGVGFALGRSGAPAVTVLGGPPLLRFVVDQAHDDPNVALPGDAREVFPLTPGPGQSPGAGSPPPGQTPGQGECTVLMYRDGQFYRMQPGAPGSGANGQNGDNELFPLQPQQVPAPNLPQVIPPEMRS